MCIYVRVYIYIFFGAHAQGNMVGGQKYARFFGHPIYCGPCHYGDPNGTMLMENQMDHAVDTSRR